MKEERKPDNPGEGMTEDEERKRTMESGKHHTQEELHIYQCPQPMLSSIRMRSSQEHFFFLFCSLIQPQHLEDVHVCTCRYSINSF